VAVGSVRFTVGSKKTHAAQRVPSQKRDKKGLQQAVGSMQKRCNGHELLMTSDVMTNEPKK